MNSRLITLLDFFPVIAYVRYRAVVNYFDDRSFEQQWTTNDLG